jgi:hypothetical protein
VKVVAFLIITGAIVLSPSPTAAVTPLVEDAATILGRMKAALEPSRPSVRRVEVVLRDPHGAETSWTARQARKHGPAGNRVAMVMLSPPEVAGSAFLIEERTSGPDAQWVYLPAVRRVRKIMPVGGLEPVFGTDFTYADLGFVELTDRGVKLLGTEAVEGGGRAYRVEETPRAQWYYSRIVSWIGTERLLPIKRVYHGAGGDLWKTQVFENVTVIDGVPTPLIIRMENALEQGSTELRITNVRYDHEIPDAVFDPDQLSSLREHAVWQSAP